MKITRLVATAAVAALVLAGCSSGESPDAGAQPGEVKKVSMTLVTASSVPSMSTELAVYAVPKSLGFFADENLDVDMITADGSTAAIQALASGSADVSFPEGSAVIASAEKNIPVKSFAGIVRQWQWVMSVLPNSSVQTLGDLKGKKIGVISLASGSYMYAKAAVKAAGLDPAKDVEYVPVGFGKPAAEALNKGQVDAVALYTTLYTELEATGDKFRLLDNPALFKDLVGLTWAAKSDRIADDPDMFARFARAAYRGIIYTLANPEAAVKIGYETWPDLKPAKGNEAVKLKSDIDTIVTEVNSYVVDEKDRSTWKDWGQVDTAALTALRDYAREGGLISSELSIDKFWDGSVVGKLTGIDTAAVIKKAES